MKRISVLLILITSVTFHARSQEDTLRIKPKQLSNPFLLDSLRKHKSDNIYMKELLEESIFHNDILNSRTENITYSFSPIRKKKGTFDFNAPYVEFIIPTALISYGLLTQKVDWLKKLDVSSHNKVGEHFTERIHLDDYLQFAPAVAVYGLDLMGVKAKHNFRDRTFVMAMSHLLMATSVYSMKRITGVERPNGSNFRSFPSGHTATAFTGAHILFKEYKDTSPWIAVAGYAAATATGGMRVYNQMHWVSDVVAGAGIGILSVELSYLLLPVFHNVFGISDSKKSLVVAPIVGQNNYGVGLAYTF